MNRKEKRKSSGTSVPFSPHAIWKNMTELGIQEVGPNLVSFWEERIDFW
jgi:hypothetical protein